MTKRLKDSRQRGSMSTTWTAVLVPSLIVFIGLAVDQGGQMQMKERAADVAAQAARAGGQQLDKGNITGKSVNLNTGPAAAAANNMIRASGFGGNVVVRGSNVVVNVTGKYQTKLLGLVGINTLTVSASAESRSVYVVDGKEN